MPRRRITQEVRRALLGLAELYLQSKINHTEDYTYRGASVETALWHATGEIDSILRNLNVTFATLKENVPVQGAEWTEDATHPKKIVDRITRRWAKDLAGRAHPASTVMEICAGVHGVNDERVLAGLSLLTDKETL